MISSTNYGDESALSRLNLWDILYIITIAIPSIVNLPMELNQIVSVLGTASLPPIACSVIKLSRGHIAKSATFLQNQRSLCMLLLLERSPLLSLLKGGSNAWFYLEEGATFAGIDNKNSERKL